jgi:predicted Rossmann-fold nucleotide-binding protein
LVRRLPIVGVMGSGRCGHRGRATALGDWLARQQVHLLTGGGGGVMAAVSEAFHAVSGRSGLVLGVLPAAASADEGTGACAPPPGYPNEWVELPIRTHLPLSGERGREPLSRNHINVLSADVVIALPGGAGTASEVALALDYGRPVIAYLDADNAAPGLPEAVVRTDELTAVQRFVLEALGRARADAQ